MRPTRHGRILRAQVSFMLAFYALAVCRGLIPGLCATLSDADADPALARVEIAAGCCSQGDAAPAGATESTHCAFCTLMTKAAQSVECPVVPGTDFIEQPGRLDGRLAPDIAILRDPNLRRGPPALA